MEKIHYIHDKIDFIKKHSPKRFHHMIRHLCFEWFAYKINERYDFVYDEKQWGGKIKNQEFIQKYKGYKFRIHIMKKVDDWTITILTHKTNPLNCAVIDIDTKSRVAALTNMSSYKDCTIPDLTNKGGSLILNFIIGFLKLNKKKFDINKIVLRDNSAKVCPNCPEHVLMSTTYFLLYGDTWYGKYGFRSYDTIQNGPDESRINIYIKDQKVIKNAKVGDVDLIKYFKDAVNKYKIKDVDVEHFNKLFILWKDKPLSQILRALLKDYDKYCCIFNYVSDRIYEELDLFKFTGLTFYLDI
jgi:hypothetical protein